MEAEAERERGTNSLDFNTIIMNHLSKLAGNQPNWDSEMANFYDAYARIDPENNLSKLFSFALTMMINYS